VSPVPAVGARYAAMFRRLAARGEGAFIPFAMLGDPGVSQSLAQVRSLVLAGADALELGLPFSDPVADGPVIQAAASRALAAGVRSADCWTIIAALRAEFPDLPIGLLVYANLVFHREPALFYGSAAAAGVDSVLIADLPVAESEAIGRAARAAGIAPVYIAPPNADDVRLAAIAAAGAGYTYVTTREGVTGADQRLGRDQSALIAGLRRHGAPPPVLGFGIATPGHVRAALAMGAAGAISGSAIVSRLAAGEDVEEMVRVMKAATRPNGASRPGAPPGAE
jgi:tryptophan synthase alpha chain